MKLFKRAILYITRKWKKSLLIFGILFAVSTLIMLGLAISDAEQEQSTELRGTTGASFTIERNLATGEWANSEFGSYSTQDSISDEMLSTIAKTDGIESYNASISTILTLASNDGYYLEAPNSKGIPQIDSQYFAIGCNNSAYNSSFLARAFSLVDGGHLESEDTNGVLISEEMATKNNFQVGDTFVAVNDPYNNDPIVEIEVIGIFEVLADKTDERNNYNMASYYDYSQYIFVNNISMKEMLANYPDGKEYTSADFFVSDPLMLENVILDVQNIGSVNWDNYIISANNEVYEKTADTMSDLSTLITTLIIAVVAISSFIIVLILFMQSKNRKKEIGILLGVGVSKISILAQYIIEVLLVGVIAFPLSYLFSGVVAGEIGNIFADTQNVVVTTAHFIPVILGGVIILTLSVVISCIPVMRLKPKDILSQTE